MGAGGSFEHAALGALRAGERYALRTTTGDAFTGRGEFLRVPRGFCVTVAHLNDAPFWLTIEGAAGQHDVQLWLSAYGMPQAQVDAFGERWAHVLERLFA